MPAPGSNASGVGGSPARGLLQPTGSCPPLPGQHAYTVGGSVADPGHRDQGSLLTLSVLVLACMKNLLDGCLEIPLNRSEIKRIAVHHTLSELLETQAQNFSEL